MVSELIKFHVRGVGDAETEAAAQAGGKVGVKEAASKHGRHFKRTPDR